MMNDERKSLSLFNHHSSFIVSLVRMKIANDHVSILFALGENRIGERESFGLAALQVANINLALVENPEPREQLRRRWSLLQRQVAYLLKVLKRVVEHLRRKVAVKTQ